MLLTAEAVPHFLRFFQLMAWIVVPVMLVVVSITIYLHYRRRRRDDAADHIPAAHLAHLLPREPDNGKPADYIFFDHSGILKEYQDKLAQTSAQNTALRQNFDSLQKKYEALAVMAVGAQDSPVPKDLEEELSRLVRKNEKEKQALKLANEQLAEKARILKEGIATEEFRARVLAEKEKALASLQNQLEQQADVRRSLKADIQDLQEANRELRRRLKEAAEVLA